MNNFTECYEYSMGAREQFDASVILKFMPNGATVEKTDSSLDKQGVDYIVTLKDGSTVTIDAKTRKPGAGRYWHGEPELCLERYSVVEEKKVGWLFKNSPVHPDYILYTFDKSDTDKFYIFPYVLLRKAAYVNWKLWERRYGIRRQGNTSHGGYNSDAIFVPAGVLVRAVSAQMEGTA